MGSTTVIYRLLNAQKYWTWEESSWCTVVHLCSVFTLCPSTCLLWTASKQFVLDGELMICLTKWRHGILLICLSCFSVFAELAISESLIDGLLKTFLGYATEIMNGTELVNKGWSKQQIWALCQYFKIPGWSLPLNSDVW